MYCPIIGILSANSAKKGWRECDFFSVSDICQGLKAVPKMTKLTKNPIEIKI